MNKRKAEGRDRESRREAIVRTAAASRVSPEVDVGRVAERASKAYWLARQEGASTEQAERAARQSADDWQATVVLTQQARRNLGDYSKEGVFWDIALGGIVPAMIIGLMYASLWWFGIDFARNFLTAGVFVLTTIALLSVFRVLRKKGGTTREGTSILGVGIFIRIFRSVAVTQAAGTMLVGVAVLVLGGQYLLTSYRENLARSFLKIDKAALIALVAADTQADLSKTRALVRQVAGGDWIEVERLESKSGVVLARAELPTGRAVVRFDATGQLSGSPSMLTAYVKARGGERPYTDYLIGVAQSSDVKQMTLKLRSGETRTFLLADDTSTPKAGTQVVVAVNHATGKAMAVQPFEVVVQSLQRQ